MNTRSNPRQRKPARPVVGPRRQQGVVMAIALIMLLMLTIIGVTSMSSGNLQEVMARNMLDRNYAFQAGESALRDAEIDVENNMTAGADFDAACTDGLCLPPAATTDPPVWESVVDWDSASLTREFGEHTGGTPYKTKLAPSLAAPPKYIIEYNDIACVAGLPGEDLRTAVKFDKYRITSQAAGRSSQARIRLQSTYRKRNGRC